MFKRIGLFLITNGLIMVVLLVITNLFGLGNYATTSGYDYKALLIFSLVWGMAGSLISLAMSRVIAKWSMKVKVIDPSSAGQYREIVDMVHRISRKAGLPKMPEVGIYQSEDVNAFATGPTKSRSLVAVSSGLLQYMNKDEVEGVIAHEIAHISNGDMVTMTLLQGILNAFVIFFAKVVAFAIAKNTGREDSMWARIGIEIALQIVFTLLASFVIRGFSRYREFKADAGSSSFVGKEKMIAALEALQRMKDRAVEPQGSRDEAIAALCITTNRRSFKSFLSTHPPLQDRIDALRKGR